MSQLHAALSTYQLAVCHTFAIALRGSADLDMHADCAYTHARGACYTYVSFCAYDVDVIGAQAYVQAQARM